MADSSQSRAHGLDLDACDWLGFDLDHTLVRYQVPELSELIRTSFIDFLVKERGYNKESFSAAHRQFFARGLLFDVTEGNFLKLRADGYILTASHGTQPLTREQITAIYPSREDFGVGDTSKVSSAYTESKFSDVSIHKPQLPHLPTHIQPETRRERHRCRVFQEDLERICHWLLEDGVKDDRFFYFSTFFDMPGAGVLAEVIDTIDANHSKHSTLQEVAGLQTNAVTTGSDDVSPKLIEKHLTYEHALTDLIDALEHNFSPSQFGTRSGHFFTQLLANPHQYVCQVSRELRSWLRAKRMAGVRLFILTNSHVDFASFLMETSFGENWEAEVDLTIFAARKPAFFENQQLRHQAPFFHTCGKRAVVGQEAADLKLNGKYVHGNYIMLQEFFSNHRNLNANSDKSLSPQVVYFGDHLTGDVLAAEKNTSWRSVAVIEELVTIHPEVNVFKMDSPTCKVAYADSKMAEFLLDSLDRWGHLIHPCDEGELKHRANSTLFEAIVRQHAAFAIPHLEVLVHTPSPMHIFDVSSNGVGLYHHKYPSVTELE